MGAVVVSAAALGLLAIFGVTSFGRVVGVCMLLFSAFAAVWVRAMWRANRHLAESTGTSNQPAVAISQDDAVLAIHRPFVNGPRDSLARYRIRLDGRIVGEVWAGETFQLPIEPALHAVSVVAAWPYRGPTLTVTARRGTRIDLECFPANPYGSAVDLLRPLTWITLRRVPTDAPKAADT